MLGGIRAPAARPAPRPRQHADPGVRGGIRVRTAPPSSAWLFARERTRRALWVCSPIGLGHILRDLAIARALREQMPDLAIEWLAQPPVTRVLEEHGETIHPASAELASESAHWESEAAAQHDLHAFYAFRRMDEIFCANYMLFDDVVRETPYDLWVGDESWEVDHFLHENPERKIAPYAFLTDVTGFLPVDPDGDPREADLCADYNAEIIEHLDRFPYVRDRSVFIGGFDELPDASLGPGLPRRARVVASGSTRAFRTSSRSTRPATGARRPCAVGSGTAPATRSTSRRSAARPSGGTCSNSPRTRSRWCARPNPTRACSWSPGRGCRPTSCPMSKAWTSAGTSRTCSSTSPAPTSPSCRAACRPRWSSSPLAVRSSTSRWRITGSSNTSWRIGSTTTAPASACSTRTTRPADLAEAMLAAQRTKPAYRPIRRGGAEQAARQLASVLQR